MKTASVMEAGIAGLLQRFAPIGALPGGGVTRLGYTEQEDEMHRVFRETAAGDGFRTWTDCAGNSFAANFPEGTEGYTLIGSHLDSVVEGGVYDGVAGVAAGLMVLRELRDRRAALPVAVAAFRCEESSNFKLCTIGSGLFTGAISMDALRGAVDQHGLPLTEHLRARGFRMELHKPRGIARYLELHIEQGRVLQEAGKEIGVVTAIAAPYRYTLTLRGVAEHSGATPMGLRKDALCAAAEVILALEAVGQAEAAHHSVATVGAIENHPNVLNAVPGTVTLQIDLRCIEPESMERMVGDMTARVREICGRRGVEGALNLVDTKHPARLDAALQDRLAAAADAEGLPYMRLPSGAGHDAMSFVDLCPTGMVFIPCRDGISHNIAEHTELYQIENGTRVLLRALTEEQT